MAAVSEVLNKAERRDFEMSPEDLRIIMDRIAKARSAPLIMLQCGAPPSLQEVANDAWAVLGRQMGFDPMTVRPNGKGDRFFSAMPTDQTPGVQA